MEQFLISAFGGLQGSGIISFLISFIALVIGGLLFFRKINIEQITSVGSLQQNQIKGLIEQIDFLSTELTKARTQIAEIHQQNIKLMEHIRDSNKRIQELENLLNKHQ